MADFAKVQLKTQALDRFERDMQAGLNATGTGIAGAWRVFRVALGVRYSAFARRRFNNNARGGGDWVPLALSTLRRKLMKGKKGQSYEDGTRGGKQIRKLITKGNSDRTSLARDTKRGGKLVGFSGRSTSILIDTGVLQNALQFGGAGNRAAFIPGGIEFGFADDPHPPAEGAKKGPPSIAVLAGWHNFGRPPHLPQRILLPGPDAQTIRGFQSDMQRAIAMAWRDAEGGGA